MSGAKIGVFGWVLSIFTARLLNSLTLSMQLEAENQGQVEQRGRDPVSWRCE
jgi:hypothetical protein